MYQSKKNAQSKSSVEYIMEYVELVAKYDNKHFKAKIYLT
jgi:hypothetical protein